MSKTYIGAIVLKALFLKRSLGTAIAAGYLRNHGFAPEAAVSILAKKGN